MKQRQEKDLPELLREILSEGHPGHGVMEDGSWEEEPSVCRKALLFFSRELDGEAREEDRASAKEHFRSCSSCRRQVEALRSLERLQEGDRRWCRMVAEWATPEVPPIGGVVKAPEAGKTSVSKKSDSTRNERPPFRNRVLPDAGASSLRWVRWGWQGAAVAALLLLGRFWGESTSAPSSAVLSREEVLPVLVTPARWSMARSRSTSEASSSLSEAPFAERLQAAREEIAEELRKTPPDWSRIRRLTELVGELRTDLELLALHMAYLDIVSGTSPDAVAERWHALSGQPGAERKESF